MVNGKTEHLRALFREIIRNAVLSDQSAEGDQSV